MTNKPKWKDGRCSEACRNWLCFCCQDCARRKQLCKSHCKQALNARICKHFVKEAIEVAFEWMSTRDQKMS